MSEKNAYFSSFIDVHQGTLYIDLNCIMLMVDEDVNAQLWLVDGALCDLWLICQRM